LHVHRWISFYEYSSRSIEVFTHAKMREMGLNLPEKYGSDFTYSQKVLDISNQYFRKSVAKDS